MATEIPPLPEGFTLDAQQSSIPPLPAGFTLDAPMAQAQPAQEQPAPEQPSALNHMLGVATRAAIPGGMARPIADLANRYMSEFADAAGQQANDPIAGGNLRANIQSGGVVPKDYAGSPAAATAVNVGVQLLPSVLFRGAPNVPSAARAGSRLGIGQGKPAPAAANAERQAGLARVPEAAPSVEELGAQAKAAYKRASEAGIKIAPASFKNLKQKIHARLQQEGVDSGLHPDTTRAFKKIAQTQGELTLDQLETLRKVASDAKGSIKPADRRLASIVVDELDDYVGALSRKDLTSGDPKAAAALDEARGLYTRQKKSEEIQNLIDRAEIKAGANYTSSGMENALRQEFKALALNKNRIRRFNAEEQAAIKKVAMGGSKMENAVRLIGKLSPSDRIGQILGFLSAASTGFIGLAVPAVGTVARGIATRATKRSAAAAEELMRRGPNRKSATETREALKTD